MNMKYRKLGKTDLEASEIGIGCTYFSAIEENELKRMFDKGIDAGMNMFDFCEAKPVLRDRVGRIIKGRRNKLIIQGHLGLIMENEQEGRSQDLEKSRKHIEDFCARLSTDYIDIAMLHCIDQKEEYEKAIQSGLIDYMVEQKKKGVFRYLGFSSHEPELAGAMVKSGNFDVVMFSISPLFDFVFHDMERFFEMAEDEPYPKQLDIDERRASFYVLCKERGVGITAMKALGAGSLVDPADTPFGNVMTVPQCLHYALKRPAVGSVVLGFKDTSQMEEALRYYETDEKDLDCSHILSTVTGEKLKRCLYCNHCLPCSSRIDIGGVTKLLDTAATHGKTGSLSEEYNKLKVRASECNQCGLCMKRCPFGIDIVENMKKAAAMFEMVG